MHGKFSAFLRELSTRSHIDHFATHLFKIATIIKGSIHFPIKSFILRKPLQLAKRKNHNKNQQLNPFSLLTLKYDEIAEYANLNALGEEEHEC